MKKFYSILLVFSDCVTELVVFNMPRLDDKFVDADFDGIEWKEKDSWRMYYEGVSRDDAKHRIMMATSKNGKTWTKVGLAFDVGEPESWDCEGVGSPHTIRMDDGTERMYYTGQGKGGSTAIGVAKLSPEREWVREQATVAFV